MYLYAKFDPKQEAIWKRIDPLCSYARHMMSGREEYKNVCIGHDE